MEQRGRSHLGSLASVRMRDGAQLFINDRDLAMHLIDKSAVVVEPAAVRRPMELNDAQREEVEGKEVGYLTVAPPFPDWASVESGFAENEGVFNVRKAKNSKKAQAERTRTRDDRALHEKHEKPEEPEEHDIQEHGKHETCRHGMLEMHEKQERHEKHEKFDKPEQPVNPDPFLDHDPWARRTHEKYEKLEQPEKPDQVVGREREPARERERDRNRDQSPTVTLEDFQRMLREIALSYMRIWISA